MNISCIRGDSKQQKILATTLLTNGIGQCILVILGERLTEQRKSNQEACQIPEVALDHSSRKDGSFRGCVLEDIQVKGLRLPHMPIVP